MQAKLGTINDQPAKAPAFSERQLLLPHVRSKCQCLRCAPAEYAMKDDIGDILKISAMS